MEISNSAEMLDNDSLIQRLAVIADDPEKLPEIKQAILDRIAKHRELCDSDIELLEKLIGVDKNIEEINLDLVSQSTRAKELSFIYFGAKEELLRRMRGEKTLESQTAETTTA